MITKLRNEKWVDVPTYEGLYQVSTLGRVASLKTQTILSPDRDGNVSFYKDSKNTSFKVSVLMACTFLGQDINALYKNRVLFRDKDSSNFKLDNLYIEDTSSRPGEEWRPVLVANGGRKVKPHYEVSNLGRVRRVAHEQQWLNYGRMSTKHVPEKILSTVPSKGGYQFIWLAAEDGTEINAQVHRLVATAFCENDDPEHKVEVNHIDGNKNNNYAVNLEWVTRTENVQHALRTGLKHKLHRTMRYPVKRLETGEVFNSMADAERAMGRCSGYLSQMTKNGHTCADVEGNIWTVEIMEDTYQYIASPGQACQFEEHPEVIYISMGQASRAIGRWEGYVSECLKANRKIISNLEGQEGRELHLVFVEPDEVRDVSSD